MNTHKGPWRCRAGLATVSMIVLLAACTSGEDAAPDYDIARERVLGAAAATRSAGTARVMQTLMMEFPEGGSSEVASGSIKVVAEGYLDLPGRRGRLALTTEGSGVAGADALGGDMDMILDGESMYMRSAFYQQLAPNHEPWLRVTFEELGSRGISQLGQQDPLAFVEALQGLSGQVEEVADEEVRGVLTTHYRTVIDVDRLISQTPRKARGSVEASFGRLGIEQMPMDVWLDEQGRLRRMASDVELTGDTTAGGRMELLLELYDFGVAFRLAIPPDKQIAEFGEVFGATGG